MYIHTNKYEEKMKILIYRLGVFVSFLMKTNTEQILVFNLDQNQQQFIPPPVQVLIWERRRHQMLPQRVL